MKTLNEAALKEKFAELQNFTTEKEDEIFAAEVAMRVIDGLLHDEPMTQILTSEEVQNLLERSVESANANREVNTTPKPPAVSQSKPSSSEPYVPIKDTILSVLNKKMTAKDVYEAAKKKVPSINEGSISATLSRMKNNGEIKKDGDFYSRSSTKSSSTKKAA